MSDHENDQRKKEQSQALDIHRSTGAVIETKYLTRRQEMVAVNRNDLEDILEFSKLGDGLAQWGSALAAGGFALVGDRLIAGSLKLNAEAVIAALLMAFGGGLFLLGLRFQWKRKNRVERIFRETTSI